MEWGSFLAGCCTGAIVMSIAFMLGITLVFENETR